MAALSDIGHDPTERSEEKKPTLREYKNAHTSPMLWLLYGNEMDRSLQFAAFAAVCIKVALHRNASHDFQTTTQCFKF